MFAHFDIKENSLCNKLFVLVVLLCLVSKIPRFEMSSTRMEQKFTKNAIVKEEI